LEKILCIRIRCIYIYCRHETFSNTTTAVHVWQLPPDFAGTNPTL